ncbi:hypothetical protein CTheo_6825 [Ceratobasidium theobromae]|uniref:C2 NT-type domain-containing protein n=1 Tax=Ceratobasidium theobromae TaxID=1582974 RepID=A0A5N5QD79_9AGAM|nr:hypothetical protein CTheo_6825 [Ceratobasidium theobromae]
MASRTSPPNKPARNIRFTISEIELKPSTYKRKIKGELWVDGKLVEILPSIESGKNLRWDVPLIVDAKSDSSVSLMIYEKYNLKHDHRYRSEALPIPHKAKPWDKTIDVQVRIPRPEKSTFLATVKFINHAYNKPTSGTSYNCDDVFRSDADRGRSSSRPVRAEKTKNSSATLTVRRSGALNNNNAIQDLIDSTLVLGTNGGARAHIIVLQPIVLVNSSASESGLRTRRPLTQPPWLSYPGPA